MSSWQGEYYGSCYLPANTTGRTGAALAIQHASTFGTLSTPNGAVVVGFGKRPITILLTENSIQMLDSVTNELMQQTEFTMVLGVDQVGPKIIYTMRTADPRLAIKIAHALQIPNDAEGLVSALRQRCKGKIPPDVCLVTNDTPDVSVMMAYYLGFVKVPEQKGLNVVGDAIKCNSQKRALNEKKRADRKLPKSSLLTGVSRTDDIGTHVSEYPIAIVMSGRSTRFIDMLTGSTVSKFFLKQIVFQAPVVDDRTTPDVYGMIMHNTKKNESNCHLFWVNTGQGKVLHTQLSRALKLAENQFGKSDKKPEKGVFTALEGYAREKAPDDLYRKQIRRGHLIPDKCLGAGEYGEVYLATQTNVLEHGSKEVTSKQRAVKLLKAGADKSAKEEFTRECQMLIECEGTGIVRMLGVAVQQAPWLCVLEYLEFGDLRSFLKGAKAKNVSLTTAEQLRICAQLASGCGFISKARVVHMDMAARNVLLGQANEVKIADFGMSRPMDPGLDKVKFDAPIRVAIKWTAMEAMMENVFSEASDCWSLGIVFWEICTMGEMPYANVANMDMLYFLISGDRATPPLDCPDDFWAIMCKCWQEAPEDRWRFTELTAALNGLVDKYPVGDPRDLGKYVAASKGEKVQTAESLGKEDPKYVYDVPLPTEGDGYDIPITDEGGDGGGSGGGGAPDEDGYDVPLEGSGPSVVDQAVEDTYDVPLDHCEGPTPDAGTGTGDVSSLDAGGSTYDSMKPTPAPTDSTYDQFIEPLAAKSGAALPPPHACMSPIDLDAVTAYDPLHQPQETALPGQLYEPISTSGGDQVSDVLYAIPAGGGPPKAALVVIARTEEVEDGRFVSPLEANMLRALRLIDDDEAHDHILKIRKLTEAQLSKVVKVDGVAWLATEVDLLKAFPDDKRGPRPAFRKLAKKRAKKLSKKEIAGAETHPEPEFRKRVGPQDTLVRKKSEEQTTSEQLYDAAQRKID